MDFLDDPAAIQGSRLIISDATQDESSNEYIDLEILMRNHHKRIYSFTLILPAIFPDTLILGALPLGEGGGVKHSPPGCAGTQGTQGHWGHRVT